MKSLKNILAIALFLFLSVQLQAQIKVDVNVGTPTIPTWGPAVTTQQYYFLPEIDTYYDIRNSQYVYLNNGNWIRSKNVPGRYKNYNFRSGKVIVLNDYKGRSPYINYNNHKIKYKKNQVRFQGNNGNGNNGKGNNGNGNIGKGNNGNAGNGKNNGNGKNK